MPRKKGARREPDAGFVARLQEVVRGFPSRAALAKAAGLPESSLQGYLKGMEPTRLALVAIARAANRPVEWLAQGTRAPDFELLPYYDLQKFDGYVSALTEGPATAWAMDLRVFGDALKDLFRGPYLVHAPRSDAVAVSKGDLLLIDGASGRAVDETEWPGDLLGRKIREVVEFDIVRTPENAALENGLPYLISEEGRLNVVDVVRWIPGSEGSEVELRRNRKTVRAKIGHKGLQIHGAVRWIGRSIGGING